MFRTGSGLRHSAWTGVRLSVLCKNLRHRQSPLLGGKMTAVGSRLLRKEDPALLTGEGKYVDDIQAVGQLWMGMVRSPMAHARIQGVDVTAASAAAGVHAVYPGPQ